MLAATTPGDHVSEARTDDLDERLARLEQHDQHLTQALELLARREAPAVKRGKNWDVYAAVIASFIGLLALAVSGYTAYVQRQQLRAQIWPHLELEFSSVLLSFSASNQGTGPARVTAMRVAVHGKPLRNWEEVQEAAGFVEAERLRRTSFSTSVLPAGKDTVLIKPGDSEQARTKFQDLLPGHKHAITITVCYCSVLDECWTAMLGFRRIVLEHASSDCPIAPEERFVE
jgi:hypothetical protein